MSVFCLSTCSFAMEKDSTEKKESPQLPILGRPAILQENIDSVFKELSKNTIQGAGGWVTYGNPTFKIFGQEFFPSTLIGNHFKNQKQVIMLDLGAGNGALGNKTCSWVGQNSSFVWYSLNAERFPDNNGGLSTVKDISENKLPKNVLHMMIDQFPLENFSTSSHFQSFDGSIDASFSAWTFLHLMDPLGTLIQVLNATKEGGFFFATQVPCESHSVTAGNWIAIIEAMNLDFIIKKSKSDGLLELIVRKTKNYVPFKIDYLNELKEFQHRQKYAASCDFSKLPEPLIKDPGFGALTYSSEEFFKAIFPKGLKD